MATSFVFDGKNIKLAGVYSRITSGINNKSTINNFGKVMIIDNTPTFGGGAGIVGETEQGQVYSFDNIRDLQDFVGGGKVYDLAKALFKPYGSLTGASEVMYVRAFTTTAATKDLVFNSGHVKFKVKHEGIVGNGVELAGSLVEGFAVTLAKGTYDPTKYVVKFWRGAYRGKDLKGNLIELSKAESKPTLLAQSKEVSTVNELVEWANNNYDFNSHFEVDTFVDGNIVAGDLVTLSGNNLFAGGTQTANMDDVFSSIAELDFSHIISLDYGADALSVDNFKILDHLDNEARFDKIMVVGAYGTKNDFANSITVAETFNSAKVVVVHGDCYVTSRNGGVGMIEKSVLYKAALVTGRVSGLEPQTPATFKAIAIAKDTHKLTHKELEKALDSGLLVTNYDYDLNMFVINQGINTLQNNQFLVNSDGTSYSWQLMRIAAQVNKSILINAKIDLLGNQTQGANRRTLTIEVVEEWLKAHLDQLTATKTSDNLIIEYRDISVEVKQDAYCIYYRFQPNFEVNKLFFTGIIIDTNI